MIIIKESKIGNINISEEIIEEDNSESINFSENIIEINTESVSVNQASKSTIKSETSEKNKEEDKKEIKDEKIKKSKSKEKKDKKKKPKYKEQNRIKVSIYPVLIIGMILILILSSTLIVITGYSNFAKELYDSYAEQGFKDASDIEDNFNTDLVFLLNIDNPTSNKKLYDMMGINKEKDYRAFVSNYKKAVTEELKKNCDNLDLYSVNIRVVSDDYKSFTSLFNVYNSSYNRKSLEFGKEYKIENKAYEQAYKKLMKKWSSKETIMEFAMEDNYKRHMTTIVPLKGEDGDILGLLSVETRMSRLTNGLKQYFIQVGIITLIIILFGIFCLSIFIRRNVVKPLIVLQDETERFANETTVGIEKIGKDISFVKEISILSESIEKMEDNTLIYILNLTHATKENLRVGTELDVANNIQRSMLPKNIYHVSDNYDIGLFASMTPAKEVGGDFYDFFMIDDKHLALIMADVSDKGVGAALFMAASKIMIKTRTNLGGSPGEIISFVDNEISKQNDMGMFVTVWIGIVNLETGHVRACNAGHDYPAISKAGGDYIIEKGAHGSPVGFLPGMPFPETEFFLEKGDRIFLYTDGLVEAKRSDSERYGTDRMLEILNQNKTVSDEELIKNIKIDVETFCEKEPQFDDMTMLSFTI